MFPAMSNFRIPIERPEQGRLVFFGSTLEEAKQHLSDWLSRGQEDMVGFQMTDEEGDWLVTLVHVTSNHNLSQWHIVDAPPQYKNVFDEFEPARDCFIDLAGEYAAIPEEEQSNLVAFVIFRNEEDF